MPGARGEFSVERASAGDLNLEIPAKTAQTFSVLIHELTTNAAKHGAMSVPSGRATIIGARIDDELGISIGQ